MASPFSGSFDTVHIKPFFHSHYMFSFGRANEVALEFMNMPELGFFLQLKKGAQKLRLHYASAIWIMEQEARMGAFGPADDTPSSPLVTQTAFRLFFPMDGFVTTVTPDQDENDDRQIWQEIVIEQHDTGESATPDNEITLTRYEFGLLKNLMPKLAEIAGEYELRKAAGTTGVNFSGKKAERDFECELCDHFRKCASDGYQILFSSGSEEEQEAAEVAAMVESVDEKKDENTQ